MNDLNIPSIILDPQNELEVIQEAYDRIRAASNGKINDFNASSPIAALVEGQAFVYMELLWYLNQLPIALALENFRLLGITRSPGATAKGYVTFVLSAVLATDFVVSAGYLIPFRDAGFVTKATLVIPAGSIEASVPVEATRGGSDLNVAAYGVTNTGTSLTFLNNIYNAEPINGGADLEPLKDTVERAQIAVRSRNTLISLDDYEQVAKFYLGGGYAKAYALLEANKVKETLGHVHVFLLDSSTKKPSIATCQSIQQQLRDRSFAGASIWVSPAEYYPVSVDVIIQASELSEQVADNIFEALDKYLKPDSLPLGSTVKIKEIEYLVRSLPYTTEVVAVSLDRHSLSLPMPNKYTAPVLGSLSVTITDPVGSTSTYYRSSADDGVPD